jgi:hypothetical protein
MDQKQYRAWLAEYDFIGVANRKKHEQEQREAEAPHKTKKTMETKVCKTCGRTLPVSAFSACVLTADKLQPNCKECMKRKQKDGWTKKGKAIVEAEAQPIAEPARVRVKPEAVRERIIERDGVPTLKDYSPRELTDELRRRGYIVKVYKECEF